MAQHRSSIQRPAEKDPALAAFLSIIFPGLGHMYLGRVGAGLGLFVLAVFTYMLLIVPGLLVHGWIIYDAWVKTSEVNEEMVGAQPAPPPPLPGFESTAQDTIAPPPLPPVPPPLPSAESAAFEEFVDHYTKPARRGRTAQASGMGATGGDTSGAPAPPPQAPSPVGSVSATTTLRHTGRKPVSAEDFLKRIEQLAELRRGENWSDERYAERKLDAIIELALGGADSEASDFLVPLFPLKERGWITDADIQRVKAIVA